MMSRRSNKGLFQRLLEAGSRTTYQGKIRTRGGKRTATVREGRQRIYKGVRIIPVEGGEFETSLDSSRFDSLRDAKRFVDAWKKRGNPKGTKGRFERCVKAVSERGGAYDPEAVCAAQERREIGQKELTRRALAGKRAKARKQKNRVYTEGQYTADKDQAELAAQYLKERGYTGVRIRKRKGPLSGGYFGPNQPVYYMTHHGQLTASGKRNPADAAIAVSEEFHGRKVKAMIPVQEKRHYHKYLAELGELRKLVVLSRDGKHRVTLSKFDGAILAANEDKNQLFIVGGDQSVNLNDFGIKNPHETETLGEVVKIEYFTDKEHLGDEGGVAVYTHKFRSTNDNGKHKTVRMAEYPDLIYHLRDEHLEFSGGSYEIRAEGIDL